MKQKRNMDSCSSRTIEETQNKDASAVLRVASVEENTTSTTDRIAPTSGSCDDSAIIANDGHFKWIKEKRIFNETDDILGKTGTLKVAFRIDNMAVIVKVQVMNIQKQEILLRKHVYY